MSDNYAKIVRDNLDSLYSNLPESIDQNLPAIRSDDRFEFEAFGQKCQIRPDGITLGSDEQSGVLGIPISLYALHANSNPLILEPLKAFKDFPDSMPYADAFATHTQNILIPYVEKIKGNYRLIIKELHGSDASYIAGGDFSFFTKPLPKISLCYIFYAADDDFPASVTCLYSNNAISFLPIDALADVGEYTSKQILSLIA